MNPEDEAAWRLISYAVGNRGIEPQIVTWQLLGELQPSRAQDNKYNGVAAL
jgi:hypothetical protein